MAVMASGMLAAAAVLLAASTAGQARSVRERRSAASDCSRAEVESSANGQQLASIHTALVSSPSLTVLHLPN